MPEIGAFPALTAAPGAKIPLFSRFSVKFAHYFRIHVAIFAVLCYIKVNIPFL
jgi:hypothetical protein